MGKHRNDVAGRKPGDGKPGYKNIDPSHRWAKGGASPNPDGGRRKRPASVQDEMFADLEALLRSEVPTAAGESLTVHQALLRRLVGEAVNDGKMAAKALPLLLDLLQSLQPDASNDDDAISTDDADLVRETLERLARTGGHGHD